MIPLEYYIILSSLLFAIGIAIVLTKKNIIVILMGIELILNAANLNFVGFGRKLPTDYAENNGQLISLFVLVLIAAEAAVALAIVFQAIKYYKTSDLDEINSLKG